MKVCILGLGNVGMNLLGIMKDFGEYHMKLSGETIEVVCVGDSKHTVVSSEAMDLQRIIYYKKLGDIWSSGYEAIDREELFQHEFDVVVDLTTASRTGEPGKKLYEQSFLNGRDVVTANKSPLALHWNSIMESARKHSRRIRYEATVAGGLPIFNMLEYCLSASPVLHMVGMVNGTANFVLQLMKEGKSMDEAVSLAQKIGIAEADPSIDLDGYDNAWKASILANHISDGRFSFNGFKFGGVRNMAGKNNERSRLISEIRFDGSKVDVFAGVRELEDKDPLLSLLAGSLGYHVTTGTNNLMVTELHDGPRETASAVMNDIIILARERSRALRGND